MAKHFHSLTIKWREKMNKRITQATAAFAAIAAGREANAISVKLDTDFGIFNKDGDLLELGVGTIIADYADPIAGGIVTTNGLNIGSGTLFFTGTTPLTAIDTQISFSDAIIDFESNEYDLRDIDGSLIYSGNDRDLFFSDGNSSADFVNSIIDRGANAFNEETFNTELLLFGTPGVTEEFAATFANTKHWELVDGGTTTPVPTPEAGLLLASALGAAYLLKRRSNKVG